MFQFFLEVFGHDDAAEDFAGIDECADFLYIATDCIARERRGTGDMREEIARRRGLRTIDDSIRHFLDVVVGRIAEEEPHQDTRNDDNPSCRGILPDGEDFLLADDGKLLQKKLEGAHHSTFFLVMPKAMLTKHTA